MKIPLEALKRFIVQRWPVEPSIHVADKDVYAFRFHSEEDMLAVFEGGPWMVKGSFPLLLKEWKPGMKLDPSSL